jgi:hypothetical protein
MGLKIYKIPPSYGHPPYQGGQGGSSAETYCQFNCNQLLNREILFILSTKNPVQDGAARGNRYQLPYGFKEDWA